MNDHWIAKDGKPYDFVNSDVEKLKSNEVEIIQYIRPHGLRRKLIAELDEETARKADNMIISAEELRTGEVAIYVRYKDEPDENEICNISKNDTVNPETGNNILKELI